MTTSHFTKRLETERVLMSQHKKQQRQVRQDPLARVHLRTSKLAPYSAADQPSHQPPLAQMVRVRPLSITKSLDLLDHGHHGHHRDHVNHGHPSHRSARRARSAGPSTRATRLTRQTRLTRSSRSERHAPDVPSGVVSRAIPRVGGRTGGSRRRSRTPSTTPLKSPKRLPQASSGGAKQPSSKSNEAKSRQGAGRVGRHPRPSRSTSTSLNPSLGIVGGTSAQDPDTWIDSDHSEGLEGPEDARAPPREDSPHGSREPCGRTGTSWEDVRGRLQLSDLGPHLSNVG